MSPMLLSCWPANRRAGSRVRPCTSGAATGCKREQEMLLSACPMTEEVIAMIYGEDDRTDRPGRERDGNTDHGNLCGVPQGRAQIDRSGAGGTPSPDCRLDRPRGRRHFPLA